MVLENTVSPPTMMSNVGSLASKNDHDNNTFEAKDSSSEMGEPNPKRQRQDTKEKDVNLESASLPGDDKQKDDETMETTAILYIGGLHPSRIVRAHIEKLMKPYGDIERIHMARDGGGYAFCQFAKASDAHAAMQALHGRTLLGKQITVKPAYSQQQKNMDGIPAWQRSTLTQQNSSRGVQEESKRLEDKINALKRKLQETQK